MRHDGSTISVSLVLRIGLLACPIRRSVSFDISGPSQRIFEFTISSRLSRF